MPTLVQAKSLQLLYVGGDAAKEEPLWVLHDACSTSIDPVCVQEGMGNGITIVGTAVEE